MDSTEIIAWKPPLQVASGLQLRMNETDVTRGDRVLRVRDAGDPQGRVVMYFHGTPGSRLDLSFGEHVAAQCGVRLVSFDRPGYGGSTTASFGLESIARDAQAVANQLGVNQFATLGQSGGGPFSLATSAVLGDRVVRVGVASGAEPFQLVPGAIDSLDENDRVAVALLPGDPVGAANGFAAGFEPLVQLFRETSPSEMVAAFQDHLSPRDRKVMREDRFSSAFAATMREALCQGAMGADGTTSLGAGRGTSTSPRSIARSSSGMATRTCSHHWLTNSGYETTSPTHGSSSAPVRAISASTNTSTR